MKHEELKHEVNEVSHTLGGAGDAALLSCTLRFVSLADLGQVGSIDGCLS
jgi:hypothetical protein